MGNSDKALKIITIAAFASFGAYLGYRAYKKKYPFEDSTTKIPPINSTITENGINSISSHNFDEIVLLIISLEDRCKLETSRNTENLDKSVYKALFS
jgi:uncharacterized membrane protein YebE (DUF533 family)